MNQDNSELEAAKANIARAMSNIEKRRILTEAMETLLNQGYRADEVTAEDMMGLVGYFAGLAVSDVEEYLRAGRSPQ